MEDTKPLPTQGIKVDPYTELKRIQKEYPELTFQNNGYEYIYDELEKHADVVKEIEALILEFDFQFVKFHNFKLRKDGSFDIRYDAYYNPGVRHGFQGVVYINIEKLKK